MIKAKKCQVVDLEEQIQQKIVNANNRPFSTAQSVRASAVKTPEEQPDTVVKQERVVLLNPEEYLLQYGPKTLASLQNAIRTTFKLFWDGTISLY